MAATVVGALFVLSIAALQHYQLVSRSADERIGRSLDIALEHTNKVFEEIEVLFASVDELTRGRTEQSIRLYEAPLHEQLRQMIDSVRDLRAIWLFDINGKPLVASSVFPVPDLNNSDRDYFIAQRDPQMGTYVGGILVPKIGGAPFFSVSKKRHDSSGEVTGISAVVVPPSAFERFFATLSPNEAASFAVIREDGAVLARYPVPTEPNIVLSQNTGFRKAIAEHDSRAKYTTVSGVDGRKRRFEVQRMTNLPLYVTSSLEETAISEEWRDWLLLQLAVGVPALLLILWLEYLTLRRTNQFYAEVQRRESAEALVRQSQKLEAIGQLTGGIAHDFNNLLSIVIGNLEAIIRRGSESDKTVRQASNALLGAERASQLVRRLLAFSRRQPLDPKPVDVNQVVTQVVQLLRRSLGEKIQIEASRSADLCIADVDPVELEASTINLAINARDAMPDGGRITIAAANAVLDEADCADEPNLRPGEYVTISVSDQGTGMTPEVLEHVFEPFFTTKAPGQGSGLGLSQVYGFARQSSGHVAIESRLGVGTTVKLYLPRSHAARAVLLDEPNREILKGRGESILIVEDDPNVREHLAETVAELNYHVLTAGNAEEALALISDANTRIDLLLTDVVMPGLNGRQLADLARAKRPTLRVLFMTGYARDTIVHEGRLDPGVLLIQKPVAARELSHRLRTILDGRLHEEGATEHRA